MEEVEGQKGKGGMIQLHFNSIQTIKTTKYFVNKECLLNHGQRKQMFKKMNLTIAT